MSALEDELSLTLRDPYSTNEERWITVGADALGRLLVVVYTWRGERLTLISARPATLASLANMRELMKCEYNFSSG